MDWRGLYYALSPVWVWCCRGGGEVKPRVWSVARYGAEGTRTTRAVDGKQWMAKAVDGKSSGWQEQLTTRAVDGKSVRAVALLNER